MRTLLKSQKGFLIALAVLLAAAAGWLLFWKRIAHEFNRAADEAPFQQLTFGGAYYTLCDNGTVRQYLGGDAGIDRSLCGSQLGEITVPTEKGAAVCTLYACKPLEEAGKEKAIILSERNSHLSAYELTGFQYLDNQPSIWAVCASYGIGAASDLESVAVYETDGTELAVYTDPADLQAFYEKFVKLGENLSDEETEKAYLEAYRAEYGDAGTLRFENGTASAEDDETYRKAMELWSRGVCYVDIRLTNGLQLRKCVYAPQPKLFTVYGVYRFNEPFFAGE